MHTIRDPYSGMALAIHSNMRIQDSNYENFKFFGGIATFRKPSVVVKSDAAKEMIGAVQKLGWHFTPTLENQLPHNSIHDRWHRTIRTVVRANM